MRVATLGVVLTALAAGGSPATAQDGVAAAYRAALEASPTPRNVEAEQAEWARARAESAPDVVAQLDVERVGMLEMQTRRDRLAADAAVSPSQLARECFPLGLDECTPDQGGWLRRRDGGLVYWQTQSGSTPTEGISGAVVFLTLRRNGLLHPVAWTRGGFYDAPVVVDDGQKVWVAAPGVFPGSGSHNADVVFRWTDGDDGEMDLTQIDNTTWKDDLAARLPTGLEVWKGVRINYGIQYATTPLWQPDDANCCATGGTAQLNFTLTDDKLELDAVTVRDAVLDMAPTVPTEVFDYAGRRFGCTHFAGEPAGDAERQAQIDRALRELRCDALDADGAALKARYGENRNLMGLIARAEASGS